MISDIYQTTLYARADGWDGPMSGGGSSAHAGIFLPDHANFSAQICLCEENFTVFPGVDGTLDPAGGAHGQADAFILRYSTSEGGGPTWLSGLGGDQPKVSFVQHVQNGDFIEFVLEVSTKSGWADATAIATIFIES